VNVACSAPLSFETLVAYWAGDLSDSDTEAVDAHVMGCGVCTLASEGVAAITEGFRATIPPVITAGQLVSLRARGLHVEENIVLPGQRTPLTFRADVDVLAHRLRGLDLSQTDHVHLMVRVEETGELLFESATAPFDASAGEVIIACQRHFAAFPPNIVFQIAAIATDGRSTATATYAIPHRFEPPVP
jgi:hypothetical protein